MNELSKEKTVTIKELSAVLNLNERTVSRYVDRVYPNKKSNGLTTYLNEIEVTEIKKSIMKNPNLDLDTADKVITDKEMEEMTVKVIAYHQAKYNEMKALMEKAEARTARLIHDGKTYTATEIAKEMNMRSAKELNLALEAFGVQYKTNNTWVLHAKYSGNGYESIKQEELDNGKIIYNRHWTGKGRDFILDILKEGVM
jgi:hypothetical protein